VEETRTTTISLTMSMLQTPTLAWSNWFLHVAFSASPQCKGSVCGGLQDLTWAGAKTSIIYKRPLCKIHMIINGNPHDHYVNLWKSLCFGACTGTNQPIVPVFLATQKFRHPWYCAHFAAHFWKLGLTHWGHTNSSHAPHRAHLTCTQHTPWLGCQGEPAPTLVPWPSWVQPLCTDS